MYFINTGLQYQFTIFISTNVYYWVLNHVHKANSVDVRQTKFDLHTFSTPFFPMAKAKAPTRYALAQVAAAFWNACTNASGGCAPESTVSPICHGEDMNGSRLRERQTNGTLTSKLANLNYRRAKAPKLSFNRKIGIWIGNGIGNDMKCFTPENRVKSMINLCSLLKLNLPSEST